MLKENYLVGSRVIAIADACFKSFPTKNKIGTIVEISEDDCIVNFDENVEGWGDKNLGILDGHGVYINYEDIELVTE